MLRGLIQLLDRVLRVSQHRIVHLIRAGLAHALHHGADLLLEMFEPLAEQRVFALGIQAGRVDQIDARVGPRGWIRMTREEMPAKPP